MTTPIKSAEQALAEDELYLHIGERITAAREKRGMLQRELAEHSKLTQAAITNIEKGRHHVKVYNLVLIAKALKIKPGSLL